MNEKIQYLIDVFIENGYERKTKQKVLKLFKQTTKLLLLKRGILKIPVKQSDIHRCPLLDPIVAKSLKRNIKTIILKSVLKMQKNLR